MVLDRPSLKTALSHEAASPSVLGGHHDHLILGPGEGDVGKSTLFFHLVFARTLGGKNAARPPRAEDQGPLETLRAVNRAQGDCVPLLVSGSRLTGGDPVQEVRRLRPGPLNRSQLLQELKDALLAALRREERGSVQSIPQDPQRASTGASGLASRMESTQS